MGNGPINTDGTVGNALAGVPMAQPNPGVIQRAASMTGPAAMNPDFPGASDAGVASADPNNATSYMTPIADKLAGGAGSVANAVFRHDGSSTPAQTPPLNVTTDTPRGNPSYVQPNRDSDTSGDASVLPGAGQYTQGRAQPGIASGNMDATAMVGKAQTNTDGMTDDQRNNAPFLEQQRQMADNNRVQNAADAMNASDFSRTQNAEYNRQRAGILAGQMDTQIMSASGRERRMLMEQKAGLIQQSMATPGEGPNLIARAQEVNAGGNSAAAGRQNIVSNAIKQQQERQGVQKGAFDLMSSASKQQAIDSLHNAKTPQEVAAAQKNLLIMNGHDVGSKAVSYGARQQGVDSNGQPIYTGGGVFMYDPMDPTSGHMVTAPPESGAPGSASATGGYGGHPEGSEVVDGSGKHWVIKNGQPVAK